MERALSKPGRTALPPAGLFWQAGRAAPVNSLLQLFRLRPGQAVCALRVGGVARKAAAYPFHQVHLVPPDVGEVDFGARLFDQPCADLVLVVTGHPGDHDHWQRVDQLLSGSGGPAPRSGRFAPAHRQTVLKRRETPSRRPRSAALHAMPTIEKAAATSGSFRRLPISVLSILNAVCPRAGGGGHHEPWGCFEAGQECRHRWHIGQVFEHLVVLTAHGLSLPFLDVDTAAVTPSTPRLSSPPMPSATACEPPW